MSRFDGGSGISAQNCGDVLRAADAAVYTYRVRSILSQAQQQTVQAKRQHVVEIATIMIVLSIQSAIARPREKMDLAEVAQAAVAHLVVGRRKYGQGDLIRPALLP